MTVKIDLEVSYPNEAFRSEATHDLESTTEEIKRQAEISVAAQNAYGASRKYHEGVKISIISC